LASELGRLEALRGRDVYDDLALSYLIDAVRGIP